MQKTIRFFVVVLGLLFLFSLRVNQVQANGDCWIVGVTVYPTGGGESSATPYNCATGVGENDGYTTGTEVTLTAAANPGYTFVNWEESSVEVSTESEYTFSISADRALTLNFSQDCYILDLFAANGSVEAKVGEDIPGYNCSTTGGADNGYLYDTVVTLTAAPDPTYAFVQFEEGGSPLTTDNPTEITMQSDRAITGVFSQNCYTLDILVSNGTVEQKVGENIPGYNCSIGGGDNDGYIEGTEVILTTTVDAGYTFQSYEEGGSTLTTDNPTTITMDEDRAIDVYITQDCYILDLFVSNGTIEAKVGEDIPGYNCSTTGGADDGYVYDTVVTLTTTADAGYTFQSYEEGGSTLTIDNPTDITMQSDRAISAYITQDCFNLSMFVTNGTVEQKVGEDIPGYNCSIGGVENDGYLFGTEVTLTTTADAGYTFQSYEEGGSTLTTDNPTTITMEENRNLEAYITQDCYSLGTFVSNGTLELKVGEDIPGYNCSIGGVENDGYLYGTEVTLTTTADTGYTFQAYEEDGSTLTTDNPTTITMTENRFIEAYITQDCYTLTILAENGSVEQKVGEDIPGYNCSTFGGENNGYVYDTVVILTATADFGYKFGNWAENATPTGTENPTTITMQSDRTVQAYFSLLCYQIDTYVEIGGTVTPSVGGDSPGYNCSLNDDGNLDGYTLVTEVVLTPEPDPGYVFNEWYLGDIYYSSDNPLEIIVSQDLSLSAIFELICYQVTIWTGENGSAEMSVGGVSPGYNCPLSGDLADPNDGYYLTTELTITATPNPGYTFLEWTENDLTFATDNPYTFTVEDNHPLATVFELSYPTIIAPTQGEIIYHNWPSYQWETIDWATDYKLQVEDPDGTLIVDINPGESEVCVEGACEYKAPFDFGLDYGTYRWRVRAESDVTSSIWSDWIEFNYDRLPRPVQISPADGSFTRNDPPTFVWAEVALAEQYLLILHDKDGVELYAQYIDSDICVDGICFWIPRPSFGQGEFKWKIRAYYGVNISYWTYWNHYTVWTDAPVPISPINNQATYAVHPTVKWEPLPNAERYDLRLKSYDGSILYEGSTTCDTAACSYTFPHDLGVDFNTYKWNVRGYSEGTGAGTYSIWLDWQEFNFSPMPAVTLSAPADGAVWPDTEPVFAWLPIEGASEYQLEIIDLTPTTVSSGWLDAATHCTDTLCTLDAGTESIPLDYGVHTWQVKARDGLNEGDFSSAWNLNLLAAPALVSPAEGSAVVNVDVTYTWNEAESADSYNLQVVKVSDASIVHSGAYNAAAVCAGGECSMTVTGKLDLTAYQWRVQSEITGWAQSAWSDPVTFTATLPQVQLRSPGVDAIVYGGRPTFKWYPEEDALSYLIEFYDATGGSDVLIGSWQKNPVCAPYCEYRIPPEMDMGANYGDYRWRVRAKNSGTEGAWSELRTFTYPQLERTSQISPEDGFTTAETTPTFQWEDITGATMYLLQVRLDDIDETFVDNLLVRDATYCDGDTCTWTIPDGILQPGVTYKWHVRAKNGRNFARWTAYRTIIIE